VTDPKLTPLELRTGIVLLSTYTTTNGYGETSLEHVAAAIGSSKGNVSRAADGLEGKSYFRIERAPYRHGVRGKPNRYYPNWSKVVSKQPINAAAADRKVVNPTTLEPSGDGCTDNPLGCFQHPNKVVSRTTNPDSLSVNKSCAPQRALPVGDARARDEVSVDSEFLRKTERWLKAEPTKPYGAADLATIKRMSNRCMEIYDAHHFDDPQAQWANRLASELAWILGQHE
jgi:hypothetical protein